MPTTNTAILTNAGRNLLNQVNAGKDKIEYTRTLFSIMDISNFTDDQVKNIGINDITQSGITSRPNAVLKDNNIVEVRSVGSNKNINQDTNVYTYVTYAKLEKENNEVPFAISINQNAENIPAYNGSAITTVTFAFKFTTQNTNNFKFDDTRSEVPTYQDVKDVSDKVDNLKNDVNNNINKEINTIDSNINTKATNIDLNKSNQSIQNNTSNIKLNKDSIDDINNNKLPAKTDVKTFNDFKENINQKFTGVENNLNGNISNQINDVNKKVDTKSDQSDLNATNNNLVTTNNKIDDINNNKLPNIYNKQDTDSSITYAMNKANGHSDQNYNNLLNKNNILSQKMEDYQKPNLVPSTDNWIKLNSGSTNLRVNNSVASVFLEGGKKYCVSAEYDIGTHVDNSLYITFSADDTYQEVALVGSNENGVVKLTPKNTGIMDIIMITAGQDNHIFRYKNLTVTQSDNYVPYEISEKNKASIQSENQFTTDYQAPNLSPISDCTINGWMYKYDNGHAPITMQVEKGKTYFFSMYSENANSNIIFPNISTSANDYKDINGNTFASTGNYYIYKWVSDRDGTLEVDFCVDMPSSNRRVSKICITQSDNYVPYEIANRDRILEHAVTNKTDNLSDKIKGFKVHNLAPVTSDIFSSGSNNQWNVPVKQGKTYYISGKVNYGNPAFTSKNSHATFQFVSSNNNLLINKFISDMDGTMEIGLGYGGGSWSIDKLCITQSNEYIPIEQTDSTLDTIHYAPIDYVENQLSNKTDNLSNQINNVSKKVNNINLVDIPLPILLDKNGDSGSVLNGLNAFFNIINSRIEFHGFFQTGDLGRDKLRVDCSNIKNYFNKNILINNTFNNNKKSFYNNGMTADGTMLTIQFRTYKNWIEDFDGVYFDIQPI